jgi:aspartate/methionine/tyrosine aminotransferase
VLSILNRLHQTLEEVRSRRIVLDLTQTNFHACGFRPPGDILSRGFEAYLAGPGYQPDPKGAPRLRGAIAGFYEREGFSVQGDALLVTASTSESYRLLFSALADPGETVLLPLPTYPLFDELCSLCGLQALYYRLDVRSDYALDSGSLSDLFERHRPRICVVISPNNPTGKVFTREELDLIEKLCGDHGSSLIFDEVFSDLVHSAGGERSKPARPTGRVASYLLNGASKLLASPDLKVAWIAVVGPAAGDRVEELTFQNDLFLSAAPPNQEMVAELLDSAAPFRETMREEIARRRDKLLRLARDIPELSLIAPEGGIHAMLRVIDYDPRKDDEDLAVELLEREGVFVHPGYFYGVEDALCLVVSYLSARETLSEGMKAIGALLGRA